MARPHVTVRDAVPDDVADLVAMWTELREAAGHIDRTLPPASEAGVLARLQQVRDSAGHRVLVASMDGAVVGMAVLTYGDVLPLVDSTAVHVHYLHVRPGSRRRGVGHALVTAAATWAEDMGAEQLVTSLLQSEREANRFFARLGFGQSVVRRVAPTAALRRRLLPDHRASLAEGFAARRATLRRVRAAMVRPIR